MSRLQVTGMRCGGCSGRVTTIIKTIAPQAEVVIDLPSGLVTIAGSSADASAFVQAIKAAGFGVSAA